MTRVGEHRSPSAAARFWFTTVLAVIGAIGIVSEAGAASYYYWPYYEPRYHRPASSFPQRHPKPSHLSARTIRVPEHQSAKPQGPVIIAISIKQQSLKMYDADGLFAESPISTGMTGHSTPMGVFSVIQKQRFHRSNIYSGAPMPYMQRITWSGIAMHAGVLPGYPASHGCIRMPMNFALKMWKWTKLGARVVITPGESIPVSLSHPLLPTHKAVPQPTAAIEAARDPQATAEPGKPTDADTAKPALSPVSMELRSSLGHGDAARPGEWSASTSLREPLHAADASADVRTTGTSTATAATQRPERPKEIKSELPRPEASSAQTPSSGEKAADTMAAENSPTVAANKDTGRLADGDKSSPIQLDPAIATGPKRAGQIAVFISRKDSKLYVRQNLAPLFEAAVTIAPDDRPLGTHVFTAQIDKDDANLLHWSVVSLPVPSRYVQDRSEHESGSRRRQITGALEGKAILHPNGPAEALDRITIPVEAMTRITEALSTGGSIIVSDQGIRAGEMGTGTDFIVPLH